MNILHKSFLTMVLSIVGILNLQAHMVKTESVRTHIDGSVLTVEADINLDSLRLSTNRQILITPVVSNGAQRAELASVLVSGRNMHIVYERGALRGSEMVKGHAIQQELQRINGRPQTVSYSSKIPLQDWMRSNDSRLEFIYDECGCGSLYGSATGNPYRIFDNPVSRMKSSMITPEVTALPVQKHEGRTRVQFEVDKTVLHVEPYVCRNGQRLDNRDQIAMIDDSVKYALTDPNVELAGIRICGYASPESPYTHNQTLATGRSRALAEYLGRRYSLPAGNVDYSAVAENWVEFRNEVEKSDEITEAQRSALLELIDAPAAVPADFDKKEQKLKTDPRFAKLYKNKILPEWFPRLRATTFEISTRLKPMSDEKLAEVLETSPEKMSLNQMYRVALLYPAGSDDFNRVILTALEYYPDDQTAKVNAATAAIQKDDYPEAKRIISSADESAQAFNLLGIIAASEEDFDLAKEYFRKAGELTEAQENLRLLE